VGVTGQLTQTTLIFAMNYSFLKTTKTFSALTLALITIMTLASCFDGTRGNGNLVTEIRKEKDFHALEISTSGTVEVRTAPDYSVEITCEENIIAYLDTEVENGVLKIHFDRNVYDVDDLSIRVSAPNWDAFTINGSANVKVKDKINGTELKTIISGSGDLDVYDAIFNKTKMTVTGSGNLTIDGSATELEANVSGSGEIEALDFPVKKARANVSGSGNIRIDVSDDLDATVSGSGDIEYQGDPKVSSQVSGSGRIRKI
jgi:Putative auto-transporter adhesin, head GIN domain